MFVPILERNGCDCGPLDAVLDELVVRRGLDGPASVHWLLGASATLAGRRPLDLWRSDVAALRAMLHTLD